MSDENILAYEIKGKCSETYQPSQWGICHLFFMGK